MAPLKHPRRMRFIRPYTILILGAALSLAAVGAIQFTSYAAGPAAPESTRQIVRKIHMILDRNGSTLTYDDLMSVYGMLTGSPGPIDEIEGLLRAMVQKRNADPRVDQMILIFAAQAVAESRFPIANAAGIFDAIMAQETRINEWVISFLADAIGRYPVDMVEGDRLMDDMEALHRRVRSRSNSPDEYFGQHFLPPPRTVRVRDYLAGIHDQDLREMERNRYYALIQEGFLEADIAASMAYLQRNGIPDGGRPCVPVMQCLIRHRAQIPFTSTARP